MNPTTKVGFRLLVLLMVPVMGMGQYRLTHTGAFLDSVLTDHPKLRYSFDSLIVAGVGGAIDTTVPWFVTRATLNPLLASKQAVGTYLVPGDSVRQRTYSNSLYQPIGTYLLPGDSVIQRTYSNSLYLGLHNTADTSKASYWATSLRTPQDSARAAYYATSLRVMPDSSRASYWASAVRGSFIDTSRASYYATSLRVMPDSSRASYWSTRLRGDTTTSAYYATSLRVMPDSSRASYWSTRLRGDTTTSAYWATKVRAPSDTAGMATRTYAVAIGTLDTTGVAYATNVTTQLSAKEPTITSSPSIYGQYWNGNKAWGYPRRPYKVVGGASGLILWVSNRKNETANTTVAVTSGHIRATPVIFDYDVIVDSANTEVSTATAGSMVWGMYNNESDTTLYPGTLMFSHYDTTSAAVKVYSLASNLQTFKAGYVYWLAWTANNAATVRAIPMGSVWGVLGDSKALGSNSQETCIDATRAYDWTLPATFTSGAVVTANVAVPEIVMRRH